MADVHNTRVLRELKVGDMVEFPRKDFGYSHWGVYLGNEKIVHLTGSELGLFSISGVGFGEQAFVRIEDFRKVADGCEAKINNIKNKRPRPSGEIVREAYSMVGKKADFNVLWNNCEHFASYLRYGEKSSDQGTLAAVVLGGAAVAVGGFFGGVMVGALFLSMKRNRDKDRP